MAKKISQLPGATAFDGTELVELVQGGANKQAPAGALLPFGYIDGLKMQWMGGNAITIASGTAYIPSLGRAVRVASAIAKTGLAMNANAWQHVYLFVKTDGSPDIEIVATAPAAPYSGTARTKAGDTSRRYLGSLRTDASGAAYNFLMIGNAISWKTSINLAPFMVVEAGQSTVVADISCAAVVPVTAVAATLILANTAASADAPMGTSDMSGTLTSVNYLQYIGRGVQSTHTMPLDASQRFNYVMTAAPGGGGLYARVAGYFFER